MSLKLDRLQRAISIVDRDFLPTSQFQLLWQRTMEAVESAINNLTDILVRLGVVEVTADGAMDLAQQVEADLAAVKNAPVVLRSANANFSGGYVLISTPTVTIGYAPGEITATFSGTTSDVPEGGNLYYTDDRARLALTSGTGIAYDSATGSIAVGATLAAYAGGDTPSAFVLGIVDAANAAAFRTAIGAGTSSTTGTVTSVQASGGTTGLTFSGGPITGSGTLTLGGTLGVANGGTGATTATGARSNLGIPELASGTYTPTLTNITNVAASTPQVTQYMRVGNVVTVAGYIAIDPTALGAFQVDMSLPVPSNFANVVQAGGTFSSTASGISQGGGIWSDATNDRVSFIGVATDTANRSYAFTFTYLVI